MKGANIALKLAEKECKAHGVPITSKRLNVFSILLSSKIALSAYEIVDSYEQVFKEPVPVITVYRVLEFLQTRNLVHKLETANKFVACTHSDCSHKDTASQFLICNECLKVKELSVDRQELEKIKKMVDQAGFHLVDPNLEMNCICKNCYSSKKQ